MKRKKYQFKEILSAVSSLDPKIQVKEISGDSVILEKARKKEITLRANIVVRRE